VTLLFRQATLFCLCSSKPRRETEVEWAQVAGPPPPFSTKYALDDLESWTLPPVPWSWRYACLESTRMILGLFPGHMAKQLAVPEPLTWTFQPQNHATSRIAQGHFQGYFDHFGIIR